MSNPATAKEIEREQAAKDLEALTNMLLDLFDDLGLCCRRTEGNSTTIDLALGFKNLRANMEYKIKALAEKDDLVSEAEDALDDCRESLNNTEKAAERAQRNLIIERKVYLTAINELTKERDDFESRFMILAERVFAMVAQSGVKT